MKCENIFCIYEACGECKLEEISIDALGNCTECILAEIDDCILNEIKNEYIEKE